jgi:hypothetical protein
MDTWRLLVIWRGPRLKLPLLNMVWVGEPGRELDSSRIEEEHRGLAARTSWPAERRSRSTQANGYRRGPRFNQLKEKARRVGSGEIGRI